MCKTWILKVCHCEYDPPGLGRCARRCLSAHSKTNDLYFHSLMPRRSNAGRGSSATWPAYLGRTSLLSIKVWSVHDLPERWATKVVTQIAPVRRTRCRKFCRPGTDLSATKRTTQLDFDRNPESLRRLDLHNNNSLSSRAPIYPHTTLTLKHPTFTLRRYGGQNRKQGWLLRQAQGLVGGVQVHLHRHSRQCLFPADARDQTVSPW